MQGVATRYPRIDAGSARLINLEGRIQQCRERRQQAEPFNYESAELLALTAYVALQSRGMPMNAIIDWQNRQQLRGRTRDVLPAHGTDEPVVRAMPPG